MFYRIIPYEYEKGRIFVPSQFYTKHFGGKIQSTDIRAGLLKTKTIVVPMDELKEDELAISTDILDALSIPLNISYQIRVEENEMRIGPVIGLLLAKNSKYLSEKKLKKYLDYAFRYEGIHGLLYVFSTDSINFVQNSVEGFYYTPGTAGLNPKWEKGIFPLPDSIYRRVSVPNHILNELKQVTGKRIFNSNYFGKWEFWNMVSKNEAIKNNVPFTRMFNSIDDIDEMFASYDSIFLKPVNGTLGKGIVKVIKMKEDYSFQCKDDKGPTILNTKEQAVEYLKRVTSGHRYLVQQDIHLIKLKDNCVDFRVNMQKDYTMKWNCTGIITCTGASGGIHSNYTNAGEYLMFEDFMIKRLSISEVETNKKKQEIIELCKKTCKTLDESGENYGDLGIDVGFDLSLKPWVFEVNKTQFHYLPLMVNDYQTYYAAKTNPVKYAAALSGFSYDKKV